MYRLVGRTGLAALEDDDRFDQGSLRRNEKKLLVHLTTILQWLASASFLFL